MKIANNIKNSVISIIIVCALISCNSNSNKKNTTDIFEKSFKEEKNKSFYEYLDSTTNIYSNFKYHIAVDAPDHWKTDAGVSEHTIFRTYQPDSLLTFSINVIEPKQSEKGKKKKIDVWEFYKKNKEQMDYPFTTLIEEQLNTIVNDFVSTKSYIKNKTCIKRSFNYNIKDLDFEYNISIISYQTIYDGFTYTFSLNIPTVFYNDNPTYYEYFFNNVYFLKNDERLDELLKH